MGMMEAKLEAFAEKLDRFRRYDGAEQPCHASRFFFLYPKWAESCPTFRMLRMGSVRDWFSVTLAAMSCRSFFAFSNRNEPNLAQTFRMLRMGSVRDWFNGPNTHCGHSSPMSARPARPTWSSFCIFTHSQTLIRQQTTTNDYSRLQTFIQRLSLDKGCIFVAQN